MLLLGLGQGMNRGRAVDETGEVHDQVLDSE